MLLALAEMLCPVISFCGLTGDYCHHRSFGGRLFAYPVAIQHQLFAS
jgi:hypothetical protein